MKCKFCSFDNNSPPKAGRDRNGIQRYYCQGCHRQIQDQKEYQAWTNFRRKRAPNQPSNKNKFDEYVTYAICKVLNRLKLKRVNGIGSSYSIASLLERAPSTIQLWVKKYRDTDNKPHLKMSVSRLQEYAKSKKFGVVILAFFETTHSLPKTKH